MKKLEWYENIRNEKKDVKVTRERGKRENRVGVILGNKMQDEFLNQ